MIRTRSASSLSVVGSTKLARCQKNVLYELGPLLGSWATDRLVVDMELARFAPNLSSTEERYLLEDDSTRTIELGGMISKTLWSTVFKVKNDPGLVVKYQADCDFGHQSMHPLVRDAWFLMRLDGTGLVPRIEFLSPPVPMELAPTRKTEFACSLEERTKCVENKRSVRFMVMERVIGSLHHVVEVKGASFSLAIETLDQLVRGLREMHLMGIVHGDIHPGNVVVMQRPEGNVVGFIDFEFAVLVNEIEEKPIQLRPAYSYVHALHSPWEILGFRQTFRCDIFKALMVAGYVMFGNDYHKYLHWLEQDAEAMMDFKLNANIFQIPGGFDPLHEMGLPWRTKQKVTERLNNILKLVRTLEQPDYEGILTEIAAMSQLLVSQQ